MEDKTLVEVYDNISSEDDWKIPWMREVCELCLEYLMLDGLIDAMRSEVIPDKIQEIVAKTLTHEDLDFFNEE